MLDILRGLLAADEAAQEKFAALNEHDQLVVVKAAVVIDCSVINTPWFAKQARDLAPALFRIVPARWEKPAPDSEWELIKQEAEKLMADF